MNFESGGSELLYLNAFTLYDLCLIGYEGAEEAFVNSLRGASILELYTLYHRGQVQIREVKRELLRQLAEKARDFILIHDEADLLTEMEVKDPMGAILEANRRGARKVCNYLIQRYDLQSVEYVREFSDHLDRQIELMIDEMPDGMAESYADSFVRLDPPTPPVRVINNYPPF